MKLCPLNDRVVVRRLEPEGKTRGGIIMPDNAKEKPKRGKVVEVGPGKRENGKRVDMDVKKGDVVLFSSYAGHETKVGDEELLVMNQDDILAVVE